jgi:GxxExxY protein
MDFSFADYRDPQTFAIIGAGIEVHKTLGRGYLEAVSQDALEIEFKRAGIPYQREVSIAISYKGETINAQYRADFTCFGLIIVELKAIKTITEIEEAPLLNYLVATNYQRGLLLNFGASSLQFKRKVNHYMD